MYSNWFIWQNKKKVAFNMFMAQASIDTLSSYQQAANLFVVTQQPSTSTTSE